MLGYALKRYGNALGPTGNEDITDAALRGIMNSVHDPYTVYLSPRENRGLTESLSGGNFGGIGVYIFQLKDGEIIVRPIDAMPAARAGMQAGDIVDSVNGKRVRGLPIDRVEAMIRGEAGSIVNLKAHQYKPPSPERNYAIVREIIHVPTVHAKLEQGIDYIQLSDFGKTSADEVRKALLDGKAKGARGYILDLRFNGGGFVDAAVAISSLFIPQGTIVSTIQRDGSRTTDEALGDAIGGLTPLVVLVNKYTASASEITSGALQDYQASDARRHADLRQGRRSEHLRTPRRRRAEDYDGQVSDAGRTRHPASRDRAERRRCAGSQPLVDRHPRRQATRRCEGTYTPTLTLIWVA